jgi:dihydropteroate synthase
MISLDSYHPETIRRAFQIGPVIVNDITGFRDPAMIRMAVEHQAKVIVSHLPNMSIQEAHAQVPVSTVEQVRTELLAKASLLEHEGLSHAAIILDPGIGFGKTIELNKRLLAFGEQMPEYPVMIGYSRKRFLGDRRMDPAPNLAAAKIAIAHNASYLRVHDVAAHMQLLRQLI